jgi:hypothetical protein
LAASGMVTQPLLPCCPMVNRVRQTFHYETFAWTETRFYSSQWLVKAVDSIQRLWTNQSRENKSCVLLCLSLALPETSTLNNTRLGPLMEIP